MVWCELSCCGCPVGCDGGRWLRVSRYAVPFATVPSQYEINTDLGSRVSRLNPWWNEDADNDEYDRRWALLLQLRPWLCNTVIVVTQPRLGHTHGRVTQPRLGHSHGRVTQP